MRRLRRAAPRPEYSVSPAPRAPRGAKCHFFARIHLRKARVPPRAAPLSRRIHAPGRKDMARGMWIDFGKLLGKAFVLGIAVGLVLTLAAAALPAPLQEEQPAE